MIRGISIQLNSTQNLPVLTGILAGLGQPYLCAPKGFELDSDWTEIQGRIYDDSKLLSVLNALKEPSVFEGELWGIEKGASIPTDLPRNYEEFASGNLLFVIFICDFCEVDFYSTQPQLTEKMLQHLNDAFPEIGITLINDQNDCRTRFSIH